MDSAYKTLIFFCTLMVIGTCIGRPCVLRNDLPCTMKDNFTDTGESEKPVNVQIRVLPVQWAYMAVGISCMSLFGLIAVAHCNPDYAKGHTHESEFLPAPDVHATNSSDDMEPVDYEIDAVIGHTQPERIQDVQFSQSMTGDFYRGNI